MAQDIQVEYFLFSGRIRSLNVQLGLNQNPTVVTTDVIAEKNETLSITLRDFVNISIGSFDFNGIVQGWDQAKIDVAGTGVYQARITDCKPVLEATQVIIGSSFLDRNSSSPFDYGDNIISITPSNSTQIIDGINFSRIKTFIESASLRYGNLRYTVKFDFSLLRRGLNIEYTIKNSVLSLVELISQVANDHGLDWFVETNSNRVINIKMFNRTNAAGITFSQLRALHSGEVIRFHEGKENRDAIIKSMLIGGYKTYLHETQGSLWKPFWGFKKNPDKPQIGLEKCQLRFQEEETSIPNLSPSFSETLMEKIINNDYDPKQFTEEEIHRVSSYASEFWGRKFYAKISPSTSIDSNGKPWVIPTSAGWWDDDDPPVCFDHDGQLKFETDDGRWVTFVQLPLPGVRKSANISYQWDDTLISNPNTYVGPEPRTNILHGRTIWIKATLEIVGSYFILTLASPLRVKKVVLTTETVTDPTTGDTQTINAEKVREIRLDSLEKAWLSLLDQRITYGPWSNRLPQTSALGKVEVTIDTSLTPWNFGFHGITNTEGLDNMDRVATARVKTIADPTTDVDTLELQVANVPKINLGTQLNRTGTLTSLSVSFSTNGIITTYKSNQYTNELSKYQKYYQDLIDKLRRKAAEQNDRIQPFEDNLDALKKELPEPPFDSPSESRDIQQIKQNVLGRIYERDTLDSPHYNLIPMAWVSDVFGSLTLVRDPSVFGNYLSVVNMGERQTAPGRLPVGTDVELRIFSTRTIETQNGSGIIVSYYMDVPGPKPIEFVATIDAQSSSSQPRYSVTPIENSVQELVLLPTELIKLDDVPNIGESANFPGHISPGTQVTIRWNENSDGSFDPFIEQQLNLFKPLD